MADQLVSSGVDRRRVVLGAVAFAVLTVLALLVAKWWPYLGKTFSLAETGEWHGAALVSGSVEPGPAAGWRFLLTYGEAVWLALVAALLIGAAAEAFLPSARWRHSLNRWGPLQGGLLALPSMMCTCCTVPIVNSLRRCGANTGLTVAYWLGNPVLNPAVLVFLLLVAPWPVAVTRLAVGILLVFGVAALVARMAPTAAAQAVPPTAMEGAAASGDAVRGFGRALARSVLRLVPEYAVLVFAVGAVGSLLFPLGEGVADATMLALLAAAVLGTLVVLPTGGEIPILLALTAAGFAPAVAGAALITLPAVSLPSALLVGRALGRRATAIVLAAVPVAGVLGGVLLTGLSAAGS